jgi:gamma-glutamyltranspeptidase/glutathione hydrolase
MSDQIPQSTLTSVETWQVRKPAVSSRGGLVASQHYAASAAGAQVLREGGNAIDAAVATSLMIGTVEPWMSGIGGGGFMLYRDAASGTVHSVDFGMRAPLALDPADYPLVPGQDDDLFGWPSVIDNRNVQGPMSIAVPGYLRGIDAALNHFGTKSFAELITPAIESARSGFAVDWYATLKIAASAPVLAQFAQSAKTYLPNGFAPAGEWGGPLPSIVLGNLAHTMEQLRDRGVEDFYQGELAAMLDRDFKSVESTLRQADLAQYQARIGTADQSSYRDATLFTAPGLTAGPTLQDALQRLENSGWCASTAPDDDTYRGYAAALRDAYHHRLSTLGDLDDSRAPGCTTHITVVDSAGNMVALTQTLLSVFGSKVMLPETGLLMNNGIMWFDPRDNQPNSMAPGKRPLSNMCPTLFNTPDGSFYALGASGGRRIMPAVMQLLSMVVDYQMDVDTAMHQPRVDVSGAAQVCVDQRLGAALIEQLQRDGHPAIGVPHGVYPSLFACPNLISRNSSGDNCGGSFVMSPWAEVTAEAIRDSA